MLWQIKKLGEVCDVRTGKKDVNQGNPKGNYPFFTCAKEHTFSDEYSFDTEALLVAGNGDVGHVSYYKGKFEAYQRTYVLSNFKDVLPRFLFVYLDGFLKETVSKQKLGNTMPYIKMGMLTEFELPLPPLSEQKRIAGILDEVFGGIEKSKENAEKNLKNSQELFESYLQNVFANPGKDWEEKKLGEVLQKTETVDPTKKPNEEFVYLDVSSVNKDTKQIENATLLMGKNAPSRARKLVKTNDVIFATVRPTHSRVALITEEYNNQVCSTGYFVLRAKDFLNNNLVYYFLLTHDFNKQMEKMQKGASYPAVNDSEVKSIFIVFPKSLADQKAIVKKLDALSGETKKLEAIFRRKIADLDELKKSVLKQAFSGEL